MKRHNTFQFHALLCTAILLLAGCGSGSIDTNYGSSSNNSDNSSSGGSTGGMTGLGYSWTAQNSGTNANFRNICFGAGRWLAVGTSGGTGITAESTDGSNWSLTQQSAAIDYDMNNASCANNTFLAVAEGGILVSSDGTSWAQATINTPNSSNYPQQLTAAAYGGGVWVVVDNLFLTEEGWGILTSTDGATWNETIVTGSYAQPTSIAYGNGTFVIVGYGGLIMTSTNGSTWTAGNLSSGVAIMSIVFANGQFVAVTNSGESLISTDGNNWSSYSDNNQYPNGIAYGGGIYLILGTLSGGSVAVSTDGQNWTNATSYLPGGLSADALTSAAYGNSMFVAVGNNGEIGTSQ
jgi:hypothetical protein